MNSTKFLFFHDELIKEWGHSRHYFSQLMSQSAARLGNTLGPPFKSLFLFVKIFCQKSDRRLEKRHVKDKHPVIDKFRKVFIQSKTLETPTRRDEAWNNSALARIQ